MDISPPNKFGYRPATAPATKKGRSDLTIADASAEERDAARRIAAADDSVKAATQDATVRLQSNQREYDQEEDTDRMRHENELENQKNSGYTALRELKKHQDAEMRKVRAEGEKDLSQMKNYYRETLYKTDRKGEGELDQLRNRQATQENFEVTSKGRELDFVKKEHQKQFESMSAEEEARFQKMSGAKRTDYQQNIQKLAESQESAESRYKDNYTAVVEGQSKSLEAIEGRASAELKNLRMDTAQKLDAYSARQRDPFYKMVQVSANVEETDDGFILRAKIPEHEQGHVQVSIHGNQFVLTGERRNEEKLNQDDGVKSSTSSFQTFTQAFPLTFPVEANALSKAFVGDLLVAHVPKKSMNPYEPKTVDELAAERRKPERLKAERPDFPANLPIDHTKKKDDNGGPLLS